MVGASERVGLVFSLSGGNAHDCREGKKLTDKFNCLPEQMYMLMDKAGVCGPESQRRVL
jgi:hypothetical protein